MAHDPSRHAWKHPQSPPPRGDGSPARGDWRFPGAPRPGLPTATTPDDPYRRWRRRLFAGGALVSLLVAGIIVLVWWWRPAQYPAMTLVAPAAPETLALPHNAYGAATLAALAEELGQGRDRPRLAAQASDAGAPDAWKVALADAREESVALYFTGHGGADRDGPFLWMVPPDAPAPDPKKHRLRVADVLAELEQLPAEKNKILVLDATQLRASWAHGMLHNDFARALKALDGRIEQIPNLVVLCASAEDQRSWVSEEWRETVFGHYFREGLKGAAASPDRRVRLSDLFDYLSREVPAWVRANRDAEQTPLLLPSQGGRERAEQVVLAIADPAAYQRPSAEAAPGARFEVPADLEKAWGRAAELGRAVPPPAAYAPHLWRRYLDLLLRAEELHRAGAAYHNVLAEAGRLGEELTALPWSADLPAAVNSLAAPRALSGEPTDPAAQRRVFEALWAARTDTEREKAWKAALAGGEAPPAGLRRGVTAALLEALAERDEAPTPENLARADTLLRLTDGALPRPVEAHYLRMLHRDLAPQRPGEKLVRQALRLRLRAEEVALNGGAPADEPAFGEQVFRWAGAPLAEADRLRRLGEDLLFATDPQAWARAEKYLADAAKRYDDAARDAAAVREAIRARNQAFAELPYYARWVAGYVGTLTELELERLVAQAEALAADAHQLAEWLQAPPAEPDRLAERLGELKALAAKVAEGRRALARAFEQDTAELTGTVLPTNWHAIDNALRVPFLPPERRAKLLRDLRFISHQLNVKSQSQQSPASGLAGERDSARDRAVREGRLAVALLGERWVTDAARDDPAALRWDELKDLAADPKAGAWWESVGEAQEQVGRLWRGLAPEVEVLTEGAAAGDLGDAAAKLARADYLARLLDSATPLSPNLRPGADLRRFWVHHLCLREARRALADGWAALDPDREEVYAVEAARRYADAAEGLILGADADRLDSAAKARRLAAVSEVRGDLRVATTEVRGPVELAFTDEPSFPLRYELVPPAGRPAGYPVFRARADRPLRLIDLDPERRAAVTDFAERDKPPPSVAGEIRLEFEEEARKRDQTASVTLTVLHRGHRSERRVTVRLSTVPDVVVKHTPPEGPARVAVLADEAQSNGAVAVLLDWSRSMKGEKWAQATAALEGVLQNLPDKTYLSVALFGESNVSINSVFGPELWRRGDAAQLDRVMDAVRRRAPDGDSTPIGMAVARVVESGFPPNFGGFRTVVLLTDAKEEFSGNPDPLGTIKRALRNRDVTLHMLLFRLREGDEREAVKMFGAIETDEFDPRGKIWRGIENQERLSAALEDAMRPRVMLLRDNRRVRELPEGLRVSFVQRGKLKD
ncbi:MAG TPA: vWA domain-containing protein, partial [Gemmataceae bacterium]